MHEARIIRHGDGTRYGEDDHWLFKQSSLTGGRFDFLVGELPYLSGPPLHIHRDQDDTFFVLEGTFTVQAGDDVMDLQPGDFVTVPPGVPHTFDNIDPRQPKVRVCNLMTPGGLDTLFRDFALCTGGLSAELMDKHGIAVVGPTLGEKLGLVKKRG